MYEIGQLIVYGNEGVCRVEEIGTPKISGVDKHRDYYTLAPIYREGKVFTPVDSKVFMRPVITREEALALIAKKAFSRKYGARNLRRAIQTDLEDPIAERIIKSYVDPFRSIKATCEDGTIKLETI